MPDDLPPLPDWRRPARWLDAIWSDERTDPRDALRGLDARQLLDVFDACGEECERSICPQIAAMGARMRSLVASVVRGDKDAEGRAVPAGRVLGIQPPSGATATKLIADTRRNALLREARVSVPRWGNLTARQAAAQMIKDFKAYQAGAWQADCKLCAAPAGNSLRACWWRLLRLGHTKPMPGIDRLSQILAGD